MSTAREILQSVPCRYAEDILSGKIVACRSIQQTCQRFLSDLKRAEKSDFPFRYDLDVGMRPVRFMETMMIPTKGAYDAMHLMPWQVFNETNIFGWIEKDGGRRRFNEALELVARGNGKTTRVEGSTLYMMSKDGERGAECYFLANSKEQAGRSLRNIKTTIDSSPQLRRHFVTRSDRVLYPTTNGILQALINKERSGVIDGLNPHYVVKDEMWAEREFGQINALRRAFKKRRQALMRYISTMGTVLDGPLIYYYGMGKDVLAGSVREEVAERMFVSIYEIDEDDDVEDSSKWIKANPGIPYLLRLDDLILDWERCKMIPQERADFITKQLNVFANAHDASFVDADVIGLNRGHIDPALLEGRECFLGFDLSNTEDFTAAALVFPFDDGSETVICHSWIPEEKVKRDNEKLDYHHYAMLGLIDIVPGRHVDQQLVLDWIMAQNERYVIRSVGYDPANAPLLVRMLQAKGLATRYIRQGAYTLNAPMKDVRALLLDGKLVYNEDPMFRWYLTNVKLRNNFYDVEKENWTPTKRDKYRKIDGFMAYLFAHTERMRLAPAIEQRDQDASGLLVYKPKKG